MAPNYVLEVPVYRPTKEEFSRPFCDYVKKVLKKDPDVPMFKVVPPEGWKPRRAPFPKLQQLEIACPIKQLVFGTRGSYRCYLVEQKGLTAQQFRELAATDEHQPPRPRGGRGGGADDAAAAAAAAGGAGGGGGKKEEAVGRASTRSGGPAVPTEVPGVEGDELLERAFWSSMTINPPLYGADTPMSLFDEKLPYGWNLRHLGGCLLHKALDSADVPPVPGVTTPMTYFGMWKSFFAWHCEDADLFSINFLHFGAPKVWYCVSPAHRDKFERMAQSLFPELHRACPAFMRHKDIMLSPALLRTYGIEYMQAKQEANEFIVLNAAAYHAGYNLGFNCAEAINFATKEWVDVGRRVTRCKCPALADGVRLSMRLFGCSSSDSDEDSDEEDEEEEEDESEEEEEQEQPKQKQKQTQKQKQQQQKKQQTPAAAAAKKKAAAAAAAAKAQRDRVAGPGPYPNGRKTHPSRSGKRRKPEERAAAAAERAAKRGRGGEGSSDGSSEGSEDGASPRPTKAARAAAAAAAAQPQRRTHATAEARAKLAVAHGRVAKRSGGQQQQQQLEDGGGGGGGDLTDSLQRAAAAAAAIRARAEATAAKQQQQKQQKQQQAAADAEQPRRRSSTGANNAVGLEHHQQQQQQFGRPRPVPGAAAAGFGPPPGAASSGAGDAAGADADAAGPPQAIVGEDASGKYFFLVQPLRGAKPRQKGCVVMRWLREGDDGLYRPSSDTWEEVPGALVPVRTQWVAGGGGGGGKASSGGGGGGFKLLTLRSRILDTELVE